MTEFACICGTILGPPAFSNRVFSEKEPLRKEQAQETRIFLAAPCARYELMEA